MQPNQATNMSEHRSIPIHANGSDQRLLLVEDDLNLGFLLVDYLEDEGFQVKLCRGGSSALKQLRAHHYDLCILDVMMPEMTGFELAERIRATHTGIPFLFLTARTLKEDVLKGYALGAEDYVTKPFETEILSCKIRAILNRTLTVAASENDAPKEFDIGRYHFNAETHDLCIDGEKYRLTFKENRVLHLLCLRMNQVLNRQDAVEEIYGKRDYFLGRSFDVFISRLRKHLRHDPNVKIENVYKVGFMLTVDA